MEPIDVSRLGREPLVVTRLQPGAPQVIPLGAIPGPPGPLAERLQAITVMIDAGDVPIAPGVKGDLHIPYSCNIVGWTITGDRVGTISVDIERENFGAFPPDPVDSITGGVPVQLINQSARVGDAATWQRAIPAGSVLRYRVLAADTVQRVTVSLTVERT